MSSLALSINLLKKPLAAPAGALDTAANMREAMLTAVMAKILAATPFAGVGTQAVLVISPIEGIGETRWRRRSSRRKRRAKRIDFVII